MNKETTNARHKLREFQWFEMQTRVRQIIQQLLAPFSKRVFQTMSNISSLKSFTIDQSMKLQQLRKVVTDDPNSKQMDVFKKIDKKQEKMQIEISQLRNLVGQTQKVINTRFEIQDSRLQQSKNIILNNMKLKQRINQQIIEQNNNLKKHQQQTSSIIDSFSKTLNTVIKDHQDDVKAINCNIAKLDDKITVLQEFKKQTIIKFQVNRQQHNNFNKELIHTEQCIKSINKQIGLLNQNLSYTKKLGIYIKQLQEKINKSDFKIQFLCPLITQAQITETLYHILPSKIKKRLIVYDYYKYNKMNNIILDSDPKKQISFNGIQILEEVEKRTTKIIIDMKRKKLLEEGVDIDNLTYEMKQKYYKEVNLNQPFDDDEEENKPMPGIDKDEITEMIQQMLNLAQKQLNRQITNQFTDSRKYIESIQQQLQHNLTVTTSLIQNIRNQNNTAKLQQELHNKFIENKLTTEIESNQSMAKEIVSVKESLVGFIKFCSLVNHLQIQDELDKQSISLFGIKETFNDQPNGESRGQGQEYRSINQNNKVVDIKKDCFSCCGFPASTMAAFKMACLTYAPSPIQLENREYRREEILEMSTKLLHSLKGQIIESNHQSHNTPHKTISQNYFQDKSVYSSIPNTGHRKNTITQESQLNNVFLYDSNQMNKTHNLRQKKELKNPQIRQMERESRARKICTAKTNYRTSTRISSSLRSTNRKMQNSSLVSTIFTQQQKKHAFYLA